MVDSKKNDQFYLLDNPVRPVQIICKKTVRNKPVLNSYILTSRVYFSQVELKWNQVGRQAGSQEETQSPLERLATPVGQINM